MPNRRQFIQMIPAACLGLTAAGSAWASPATLSETDPAAVALGYKANAKDVRAPNYVAGQKCSNCRYYQGKESDAKAPCPLVGGKLVAGPGWCVAWAKRA